MEKENKISRNSFLRHTLLGSTAVVGGSSFLSRFVRKDQSISDAGNNTDGTYSKFSNQPFSFYSYQTHKKVTISSLAGWEQQRWKILKAMEAVMGPLPDRSSLPSLDIQVKDTFKARRYKKLTIDYQAAKGERVPAYLYIPYRKAIDGEAPAMLALQPTGALGKKLVDGESPHPNRAYGKELAQRGYVVLAPDYPSFGGLKDYNFETDRYQSGTMTGIFYHMRGVDLLTEREDVDAGRLGVIGHSLGGHNAMFVGAFDSRLKVIVSSSGWTQFGYYNRGKKISKKYGGRLGPWAQDLYMPLLRTKYHLNGKKIPFNFNEIIDLLAPRTFFSNSPLKDKNFSVKGVKAGMAKARKVYQYLDAIGNLQVRHPKSGHDFPTKVRREAYTYIDRVLNHVPSKEEIE